MDVILRILANPDPCSLLGLIGVLCWVGRAMVVSRPDLQVWGYRLAAVVGFFGYGLFGVFVEEPVNADQFLFVAIRALFAAGWVLGGSWIVLSILGYLYETLVGRPLRQARVAKQQREIEQAWAEQDRIRQMREEEERNRPVPPPPAQIPRATRIQIALDDAKTEYEAECVGLNGAGLDDEELEIALLNARRKYVRRVSKETSS